MFRIVCFCLIVAAMASSNLSAQDAAQWDEVEMELEMRDRRIKQLEERVNHLWDDLHEKLNPHGDKEDDGHDHGGDVRFRLLDLSLNIMTVFGTSTSTKEELEGLQLGNHDPRRRGFTLQQAELAFAGALEPFFAGEAYLVATDETVELEEAFLRSLFLPWFELKGGYFFTEFGRINKLHPHEWRFMDQSIAVGRMLSPEGMRGLGGRAAFSIDAPWHSRWLLTVQNADDASMVSFLGEGHDHGHGHEEEEHGEETVGGWPRTERRVRNIGDLLYSFRWENAFDLGEHFRLEQGVSFATGPNATGETGRTWLAGGDLMFEWRKGDAFARIEGEFIYRYFQANRGEHEDEVLEPTVLGDGARLLLRRACRSCVRLSFRRRTAPGGSATRQPLAHLANCRLSPDRRVRRHAPVQLRPHPASRRRDQPHCLAGHPHTVRRA